MKNMRNTLNKLTKFLAVAIISVSLFLFAEERGIVFAPLHIIIIIIILLLSFFCQKFIQHISRRLLTGNQYTGYSIRLY
jgi:uncharacterized membrane protein